MCGSAAVGDGTTLLREACALGEGVWARCGELEARADSDEFHTQLAGPPLNARWLSEADSLLICTATKTACLLGSLTGWGFLIARLPSGHPSLFRWSAPCFVHLRLRSLGLSLGRQAVESFMPCMSSALRLMLSSPASGRSVRGLEAVLNFGGLVHKADLIAVPADSVGTVGISHTRGCLLDLSWTSGELQVDAARNAAAYGPDKTALQVLHGGVEAPREMQPFYGLLNTALSGVERVTPPARVSASLERFSTGLDPDRRMVLSDGRVVQEEGAERAKDK